MLPLISLLADLIVLLHFGFVGFVILGGWLVLKWRRIALLHLPAVTWGVLLELCGWMCPLTPVELYLRQLTGRSGDASSFIQRLLLPILYPDWLTRELQYVLGVALLIYTLGLYVLVIYRHRRRTPA